MARRDLSGAIDVSVLAATAGNDEAVIEEVLGLFVEQAGLWAPLLAPGEPWRDAVHTLRGAAGGVGAKDLAGACLAAETGEAALIAPALERIRTELDRALADVAAWRHELLLRGLKG